METRSNERQWTPGAWVAVFNEQTWGWATVRLGAGREIGWPTRATDLNGQDLIEREADAHLIAAAPDLYEALEECLNAEMARRKKLKDGAPASEYSDARIGRIRAALAKARGEK